MKLSPVAKKGFEPWALIEPCLARIRLDVNAHLSLQLAEVPESRMWEPAEWEQAHAPAPKQASEQAAEASSGKPKASKAQPAAPKSRPNPSSRGAPPSARSGNSRFAR